MVAAGRAAEDVRNVVDGDRTGGRLAGHHRGADEARKALVDVRQQPAPTSSMTLLM